MEGGLGLAITGVLGGACDTIIDLRLPLGRLGLGPWRLEASESNDSASCVASSSFSADRPRGAT